VLYPWSTGPPLVVGLRLGSIQLGLVAENHPQCDQVLGSDRAVPDHQASGVADGVAQRDCPEVFDREHERRAAIGQLVEQPRCDQPRCVRCARIDGSAELGTGHSALATGNTQPDQGADRRPQLGPLVIIEIGHAQRRDVVALAHHEHGIDDPDLADVTQTSQFFRDPTLEQVVVRKADHERLDGSNGHGCFLLLGIAPPGR
jgi:hypothetical protein